MTDRSTVAWGENFSRANILVAAQLIISITFYI